MNWPLWRVLVWCELWVLAIALVHRVRPIHDSFLVPAAIALTPPVALVALWALTRPWRADPPRAPVRATSLELVGVIVAAVAAFLWVLQWSAQALDDMRRVGALLGEATVIVNVSLTGVSTAACLAALALDFLLVTAHEELRQAMTWLRRTHVIVTALYLTALIGSLWLFSRWPELLTTPDAASVDRARTALYVHELAKATAFPVQALLAAMAVGVVTFDSRSRR